MIETILFFSIGVLIGIYLISIAVYINELVIDLRRFKPSNFFEWVIVLLLAIGSIVPILNSIYVYKIIKENK